MFKKVLASATLVAVMTSMLGMTAFASSTDLPWDTNGGKATVEGDGTPIEPTIEVALPGDLSFGINPLRLDADEDGTADKQIVLMDYTITNRSNVDMLVTAKTKATVDTSVDLLAAVDKDSFDELSKELNPSATAGKKAIWLVQLLPTGATTFTDGVPALDVTALKDDGTDDSTTTMGKTLTASDNEVMFKLAKYDFEKDELVAGNVSGFVFAGAVDPGAAFAEGDVKVTTVFELKTLTKNQFDNSYVTDELDKDNAFDATVVKKATAPSAP